jgi:hypothetical protein
MNSEDRHGTPPYTLDTIRNMVALGMSLKALKTTDEKFAALDLMVRDAIPAVADYYTLAGTFLTDAEIAKIAMMMVMEVADDALRAATLYEQAA